MGFARARFAGQDGTMVRGDGEGWSLLPGDDSVGCAVDLVSLPKLVAIAVSVVALVVLEVAAAAVVVVAVVVVAVAGCLVVDCWAPYFHLVFAVAVVLVVAAAAVVVAVLVVVVVAAAAAAVAALVAAAAVLVVAAAVAVVVVGDTPVGPVTNPAVGCMDYSLRSSAAATTGLSDTEVGNPGLSAQLDLQKRSLKQKEINEK